MMYIDEKYLVKPYYIGEDGGLPEKIFTIWGTAKINNVGYYQITNHDEGYYLEYVHRLVYEADHGLILSSSDIVHHIDGDKLNNDITNLEMMSKEEHSRLHRKGKKTSEETRQKLSIINKGREHTEETKKKMGEIHKKYTLWDVSIIEYRKDLGEGNRCFRLKYNYKRVNIGYFHDFTTVELISDLIEWCLL